MLPREPLKRAWLAIAALTLIGALAVVVAVVRLPDGDAGWGPNGRAWGDDEFWMDVVVHGVGWVLLIAGVGVLASSLSRQRTAGAGTAQVDAEDGAAVGREARREMVAGVGDRLADLLQDMAIMSGALHARAGYDAAGRRDDAAESAVRARFEGARAHFDASMTWLLRVPFRTDDVRYVDGPFADVYESLRGWRARADVAWASRPVTPETASEIQAATHEVTDAVASLGRLTTRWLWDGTVPGYEALPPEVDEAAGRRVV
ncbi:MULTISPECIES: hypothetical protein [unclassified Blastococcus]